MTLDDLKVKLPIGSFLLTNTFKREVLLPQHSFILFEYYLVLNSIF